MPAPVSTSGPLFDGTAPRVIGAMVEEITQAVAVQGVNDVRARLAVVLQNPTGRYERAIQTERVQLDRAVTDGGKVYGPWLEGVSSRNDRTRFKGYSTFRKVARELEMKAEPIADRIVHSRLGALS